MALTSCRVARALCLLPLIYVFDLQPCFSQTNDIPSDTTSLLLHEISVFGSGPSPMKMMGSGKLRFNPSASVSMIRSMGENDILNRLKTLPGVSTAGDYGSGLRIDGADPSQALYRIAKAPVFFPYRFGGLFSTFNSPHFRAVNFERNIHGGSMPSRLGALIDFETFSEIPEHFGGWVNIGLLASSATIKLPMGRKFGMVLSGRVSYVDQLYSGLLRRTRTSVAYDFSDFNLTANWQIDDTNALMFNAFRNDDHLTYKDSAYAMGTRLKWHNTLASIQWKHMGNVEMSNRVYYSEFGNRLQLDMPQFWLKVPSAISSVGVSGEISTIVCQELDIEAGYELIGYSLHPQQPSAEGFGHERLPSEQASHIGFEGRLYGDFSHKFSEKFAFSVGLSAEVFASDGYTKFSPNPRVTASIGLWNGVLALHGGIYRQYLHQTGFSEIGLSSDFWMLASRRLPAQIAKGVSIDYNKKLTLYGIGISLGAYWRRVDNQPEYKGLIFELLDQNYDAEDHIESADGYNAGFNISVIKESGWLTGSMGLGYGVARRKFDGYKGYLPGRTDPGFSFSATADWRLSKHWNVSANFIFSEGRRYTPTKALYLIAGNIICQYGQRNSARFAPYHRLDVGATYRIVTRDLKHFINVSLINAYGNPNIDSQTYYFSIKDASYGIRKNESLYRFLPSVSYTLEF